GRRRLAGGEWSAPSSAMPRKKNAQISASARTTRATGSRGPLAAPGRQRRPSVRAIFFQAEGGIRDWSVTGVQTCALPIFAGPSGKTRARPPVVLALRAREV